MPALYVYETVKHTNIPFYITHLLSSCPSTLAWGFLGVWYPCVVEVFAGDFGVAVVYGLVAVVVVVLGVDGLLRPGTIEERCTVVAVDTEGVDLEVILDVGPWVGSGCWVLLPLVGSVTRGWVVGMVVEVLGLEEVEEGCVGEVGLAVGVVLSKGGLVEM